MERGLLWFPLLLLFIGLAWAGWNEYQKLEAYQSWAAAFDRAKYDIYAALGQKGDDLTWGKPTRQGIIETQTLSLRQVQAIDLWVGDRVVDLDQPPASGRQVALVFQPQAGTPIRIPFTDVQLAAQWGTFLRQYWQALPPL